MKYRFYKEGTRWYVDLPQFIKEGGDKADLEMVLGADELLDELSNGNDSVEISISEKEISCRAELTLLKKHEDGDGADYFCKTEKRTFELWLCAVMIYVFGKYPDKVYIS
jgi:hypothetical protein